MSDSLSGVSTESCEMAETADVCCTSPIMLEDFKHGLSVMCGIHLASSMWAFRQQPLDADGSRLEKFVS